MYKVEEKVKKKQTINGNELLMRASGKLNRNDGIVKTGTGFWENKRLKNDRKRCKKDISDYIKVFKHNV